MSKATILEKNPISLTELKQALKNIKQRDEELTYRTGKTEEYINSLKILDVEEYEAKKQLLTDLQIPRLKPEHIVKILDISPKTLEELEVVLSGYPITITKENLTKIIESIN